ncbi:MAG: SDR family NAD(P)-dependent oxidoreductase [Pseudomonadota bacterium]
MEGLRGKTAIITGASQGLGLQLAAAFVAAGTNVCMCARNGEALEAAASNLRSNLSADQSLAAITADVSKEADVTRLIQSASKLFSGKIDILVNNAGIHGPKGPTEEIPWDEWTYTIQVNLFGSVLMTRAVVPYMKHARYGKIVQLSGGGATQPNPRFTAYAASKVAVVRYAESLAEDLREFNIDVNSVAPGALNTRLLGELLDAGPERIGEAAYKRALEQLDSGGAPFGPAVSLCLFLASPQSDGISGKLISALWDNWEQFPLYRSELNNSDVYTLRRLIGKDRGFDWGDK